MTTTATPSSSSNKTAVAGINTGPAPLLIADGTLEALKWVAAALMVLDHLNKFLYLGKLPVLFEIGRVVMPIFGFVLAYNVARPGAFARAAHLTIMKRLLVAGAVATPMFVALVGWWPLNILFMFVVMVAITYCIEQGGPREITLAVLLFVVGGAFVEFWWFALLFCLAAWIYCKKPTWFRLLLLVLATANIAVINRNSWALAALPILLAAPYVSVTLPRARWWFYAFYPAHLAVLWVVKKAWF